MIVKTTAVALFTSLTAFGALAAPPAFHAEVAGDAPALWYRFDESAGGTSAANSGSLGSAFDVMLMNGVTLGTSTSAGDTGAFFDRSLQQWAETTGTAPANLTGNPDFTCETVINIDLLDGGTNYAPFLYWGANGTMNSVYFSIQRSNADIAYVGFYNGGLRANCPYPVDGWLHIVWTRDSGGGSNDCITGTKLWVNGVETKFFPDNQLCCSSSSFVPTVQPSTFRIQRAGDFSRYVTCTLDELVLYDRVLSEQEVLDHYATLSFTDPEPCLADVNGDCGVTPTDFTAWVNAFNNNLPECDQNGDGSCTPTDFTAWITNFNAGC